MDPIGQTNEVCVGASAFSAFPSLTPLIAKYRDSRPNARAINRSSYRVKRGGGRAKKSAPPMRLMPRISAPVPSSMIVKMPYSFTNVFSTTALTGASTYTQTFRCNSIFDPDATGVGLQPRWHDQWAGIYTRYMVRRCNIKWRIVNTANSFAAWFYTAITPYTDTSLKPYDALLTSATYMDDIKELTKRPGNRFQLKMHKAPGNGQSLIAAQSKSIVPAFYMDGKDRQVQNSALFGANPAFQVYADCDIFAPLDGTSRTHYMEFVIEYEVIMYEPKAPTQS